MKIKITKRMLAKNQDYIYYDSEYNVYFNDLFVLKSDYCKLSHYFTKKRIVKASCFDFKYYSEKDEILTDDLIQTYFKRISNVSVMVIVFKIFIGLGQICISKKHSNLLVTLNPDIYVNELNLDEPIRLVINNRIIGLIYPLMI